MQTIHFDHMDESLSWYNMAPSLSSSTEWLWQAGITGARSISMTTVNQLHATHPTLGFIKTQLTTLFRNELSISWAFVLQVMLMKGVDLYLDISEHDTER